MYFFLRIFLEFQNNFLKETTSVVFPQIKTKGFDLKSPFSKDS